MVRVAYVDTVGGAAGDMLLGAFLAAGLPLHELTYAIGRLGLADIRLGSKRVERAGVRATQLTVEFANGTVPRHAHGGHRAGPTLEDIRTRIRLSGLHDAVIRTSLHIFSCLTLAESHSHSLPIEEMRFDAGDLMDTYLDVVGAAFALHWFGIARLYCSPLPIGSGIVDTPRGHLTLPRPLTVEIVRMTGAAARADSEANEQVTPTAAAILATLADFERPDFRVEARGVGAGTAELEVPNIVRLEIGELSTPCIQ